jgi:hypothetical protein
MPAVVLSRDQIVALYRSRIAAGQGRKLSSAEGDRLIGLFIEQLQALQNPEAIRALCEAEIALLEEGYPQSSVSKNWLPKYRNAIQSAIRTGQLPLMDDQTCHRFPYEKLGVRYEAREHYALTFLKYDQETYARIAAQTITNNNRKQDELQPVQFTPYLEVAQQLLQSDDPYELAVAIAAVTGRRFSEVVERGIFELTHHPYEVMFKGQLKKRDHSSEVAFLTPTLLPAQEVVAAFVRFRAMPPIEAMQGLTPTVINTRMNALINKVVAERFEETGIIPVLDGESRVTIHNLRGVYGEIAVHFFCPPHQGTHRFVQQRLGHLIQANELKQRKNSGATEHYFHYYLVDAEGQPITTKGVKEQEQARVLESDLPADPALASEPDVIQLQVLSGEFESPSPAGGANEPESVPSSPADAHEPIRAVELPLPPPSGIQLQWAPSQVTSSDSEQPSKRRQSQRTKPKQGHRKRQRNVPRTKRVQVYAKDWKQLETLIRKLQLEGPTQSDRFAGFLDWVKQNLNPSLSPELNPPLESSALEEDPEAESAVSQLLGAMTDLTQQLQQQQQQQAELTRAIAAMIAGRSPAPQPVTQPTSDSDLDSAPLSGLTPIPVSHPAIGAVRTDPFREQELAALSSEDLKTSRLKGSAQEKLSRAYEAILDHNNAPERAYAEKWVINQAVLADLTGCNRPAIQAFIQAHAEEIKAHHQQHYLRPRHNVVHTMKGVPITAVIHW